MPTPQIDVTTTTEAQRLDLFTQACPKIARWVRYFVGNVEIEALALRPGQPYSVYPKHFPRSGQSRAAVSDAIQRL
jgi:hypothetical protein